MTVLATLSWRDRRHWSEAARPCRRCGRTTHLRDDDRAPCHKVCAETELQERIDRAVPR